MFRTTTSALAITALLTLGAHAQSTDDAAAENAGEAVENAAEGAAAEGAETMRKVEEAAEGAAAEAGAAAENAGEAVEGAADAATDAAGEAAAETEAAAEEAGETMENAAEGAADAAADGAAEVENAAEGAADAATDAAAEGAAEVEEAAEGAADAAGEAAAEGEATVEEAVEGGAEVTEETVPVEEPATEEAEAPAEGETMEAEAPAEGTPVEGQIFEQSADTFLASTLLGTQVQSPDGEGVGEVDDMILGADGSVEGVVVGVGGFLGIGEKDVAVQFDAIDIQQDAETGELTFILNSTEEELEAAPEFRDEDDIRAEEAAAEAATAADGGLAPADPNAAAPADGTATTGN